VIKKNIDVELHLGRSTSSGDRDHFYLEIKDRASRLMILDIRIPLELVPDLLSNRNTGWDEVKVSAEYYQNDNIGKTREGREILFTLDGSKEEDLQKEISAWLVKNLKDGWTIHGSDTSWNSHRYNYKTKQYKLTAFRFVDKVETE
jgi:hypothetical protein